MPTFEHPTADADEVQQATRGLAHSTRLIEDPRAIYSVLGSLTSAVASLSQSLHQLGSFHDGPAERTTWVPVDSATGRAASYRVSWELHRAAEMLNQVSEAIGHAHEAEATLGYHQDLPALSLSPSHSASHGRTL